MSLSLTGITVSKVRQVLHTALTNVGGLCCCPNINCMSKRKPVTHTATTLNLDSYDYRGTNGDCNISAATWTLSDFTSGNLMDKFSGITSWHHIPPAGGPQAAYRLGDFRGYNELATSFQETVFPDVIFYNGSSDFYVTVQAGMRTTEANSLNVTDLSMPDFMHRFSYLDNSIQTGLTANTIYGCIGVILAFQYEDNAHQLHDYAYVISKLEKVTPGAYDTPRQIYIDLTDIQEGQISPTSAKDHKLIVAPCLCNYNTDEALVPLILGSPLVNFECLFLNPDIVEPYREFTMQLEVTEVGYMEYSIYSQGTKLSDASYRVTGSSAIVGITPILHITDGNAPSTMTLTNDFPSGSSVYHQSYTLTLTGQSGSLAYYSGMPSLNASTLFPSTMVQGQGARFVWNLPSGWDNYYLTNNTLTLIKGFR